MFIQPNDNFTVSICSKGNQPMQIQVCAGATVGQLSQAEAKLSSFVQPIAVTTLTGTPFPLNCQLTPSAWYVITNRATHTTPKCPEVHARQSTVLTLQGQSRFQGLLVQGPLVAVDEMQFYVQLVRNQGHQVADPLELHDFCDSDQQIATWTLQPLHSHDLAQDLTLFMVPVLARSHWFPLGLQATKGTATLMMPTDVATTVQQLVVDACGPQEVSFETFVMPTDFAADCGFQTVNWLCAKATGNNSPKAVTPAQADQWRIAFALQCLQHDQAMTQDLRLGGTLHPDQLLLQSVLKQHGVAQERLADCAANLISKLGHEAIGKALGSSQPWRDLTA